MTTQSTYLRMIAKLIKKIDGSNITVAVPLWILLTRYSWNPSVALVQIFQVILPQADVADAAKQPSSWNLCLEASLSLKAIHVHLNVFQVLFTVRNDWIFSPCLEWFFLRKKKKENYTWECVSMPWPLWVHRWLYNQYLNSIYFKKRRYAFNPASKKSRPASSVRISKV